jgi:hypothetical protein
LDCFSQVSTLAVPEHWVVPAVQVLEQLATQAPLEQVSPEGQEAVV